METYHCDRCGGDSILEERIVNGVRLGAVVCKDCEAVYPSYFIDKDIRLKMVAAKGNADELERVAKECKELIRKNKRLYKEFGREVVL